MKGSKPYHPLSLVAWREGIQETPEQKNQACDRGDPLLSLFKNATRSSDFRYLNLFDILRMRQPLERSR